MSIPDYDVTDLEIEHIHLRAIERRAQDRRIKLAGELPEGVQHDRRTTPGRRVQDTHPDSQAVPGRFPLTARAA